MELAYVTVIGAALGALARYALPGRRTYGAFLLPALAAAVTSAVWVALVWLGLDLRRRLDLGRLARGAAGYPRSPPLC